MKFSLISYPWCCRPELDLAHLLKFASQNGISAIDWISLHGQKAQTIRKMCTEYGLEVSSYTFFASDLAIPSTRTEILDSIKLRIEEALILNCHQIMIPPEALGKLEYSRREWIATWQELIPMLSPYNLTLTAENFPNPNSPLVTADDFFKIHQEVPELRLAFDTGNCSTGDDPVLALRRCGPYVEHLHLKDMAQSLNQIDGYSLMRDGLYHAHVRHGKGRVNFAEIFSELKNMKYDGYLGVEYRAEDLTKPNILKEDLSFLKNLLAN